MTLYTEQEAFLYQLATISPKLAEVAKGRLNNGFSIESVRQDIINAVGARQVEEEDPTLYAISAKRIFTPKDIGYILCGEFEGNPMASWLGRATPINPDGKLRTTTDEPWYVDEGFIGNPNFAFTVEYDSDDDAEGAMTGRKTIRRDDITAGLCEMAASYPDHFETLISENGDAITYDVAFQCIVLGSVIYG